MCSRLKNSRGLRGNGGEGVSNGRRKQVSVCFCVKLGLGLAFIGGYLGEQGGRK